MDTESKEKQLAMATEIPSCTSEHSSQYSSGASTPSTESGATRQLTTPSLPVAVTPRPALAQCSLSSRFKGVVPQPNGRWGAQIYERHARVWLGTFLDEEAAARAYDVAALRYRGREAASNYPCDAGAAELAFLAARSKTEIVDMLRKHTYSEELRQGLRARAGPTPAWAREPLFEKSLTPSDVGKLNRLVIPKHHAEKHFPLKCSAETTTTTTSTNGVLLSFEDGEGKVWRFRYSYWNSSKSYVLTKGWSRFVHEKGLGAGDTMVFSCSTYGPEQQLFIDFKKTTPKDSRCAPPLDGTLKVDGVRVVRLFGVDIAGGKRGRSAEQGPQEFLKRQCVPHGQHSPAIGAFVR